MRPDKPDLADRFRAFVGEARFPCVGAKAALAQDRLNIVSAASLVAAGDDDWLLDALTAFVAGYRQAPGPFHSFAMLFSGPDNLDETAFEAALWSRLQALSDADADRGNAYDRRVNEDPEDPRFSLSLAGEAFFVIGLHPAASRPARRFPAPALVFNPHDLFERLRRAGRYGRLSRTILARDQALAGSKNPMLARFGEMSEARQYSGRVVGEDWTCPFSRSRTAQ
ncbi:MAG: guanitoxin biosynthesis heme-dependent pre-guanitoxin N-hydroxylase GntA [Caulobacter sp.]|nr:guanitoxin biosynthesis heme-dependent pre-guanitoxin N-hydroxylase GntA [Caulobacter sp.]